MAVPKLRFKEFDGDWSEKIISDIADVRGGKRLPKGYSLVESDTGYPYITVTDMEDGTVNCDKIRYVPLDAVDQIKRYRITVDDIYISVAGTLGLVGIIPHELNNANLTENADKLTNIKCDQKYLLQYLNNGSLSQLIDSVSTVGAQPKLALYAIQGMSIFLPANPEQTKIASFLSAVDEKITQLTQKHELLSQYKQGMMQKLFSQQIRFKADDGSEFGEWEEKELKDIAEINPKSKKLPESFIYIDLESVEKGQLLLQKNIELQDAPSRAQRLLAKGDVLFQMVRPYQQNNYYFNLSGEYVASTGYAQIRTKLDSKFIYYALHEKTFLDEVMNRCTGTSYPAINSSDLSSIEILIPCLEEQTKIANFLSSIDQKIEVVAQQIEQAKQWKKGLLQQMFI